MKVILSIDPVKYPLTGIGRYTFELGKQLKFRPEIDELRFFRGGRFCDSILPPGQAPGPTDSLRRKLLKSRSAVELHRWIDRRLKARALKEYKTHVFHGPNFYLPPFSGASVVTVHDTSIYSRADCHPPERVRYMREEIELSLNWATMIITVSEFTRHEVITQFGWPDDRVYAVPLASAAEFCPRPKQELSKLKTFYGLDPGGYCLFAGTIEPRKNIASLLDAYEMLPSAIRQRWPLVLVGYKGWNSNALHARIAKAERSGWARYLGFVKGEDLPIIFAGARLFVFPSLYEGFGLPVLEAMASGVPVICSNNSSLPEVAGDAAAYCEAPDVDGLAHLIVSGLEDEGWRTSARDKGLARAAQFSWARCARETAAIYEKVMNL